MIRILTDSTADLTQEEAKALGVAVVPLCVNFGDSHYLDGVELSSENFYKMLAQAPKLPTTSQPGPEQFLHFFEAAKAAQDTLICILLSSELSGTCQSARIAQQMVEYPNIHIFDSQNATLAMGLLVRRAVQDVADGMDTAAVLTDLETARSRLQLLAIVDDLTYLRKGGRLSGAAAIAGGLLGIKPVVRVQDGKLQLAGKARGLPGAYVALFKMIDALGGIDEKHPVVVGYTGHKSSALPFVRYVSQNLHLQTPLVCAIGAVIGTHAGPGACGIAFFAQEPPVQAPHKAE